MFIMVSCPIDPPGAIEELPGNFWAQNTVTQTFYRVDAEKLYEGLKCVVWAEKGSDVTEAMAKDIADEYDQEIYQKMINNFGWKANFKLTNGQYKEMNTMEYAHALATGYYIPGGKLTILLLDIQDGYEKDVNDSYVAGYFWPYDFFPPTNVPPGYKTNVLDMIYIDTNPGLKNEAGIKEAFTTLAHEMQHLMNFTSSAQYRVSNKTIYTMDTWIDEGLSTAAEHVYSGYLTKRIGWFNQNGNGGTMTGKIDVGNNFYVWGNRVTDSDPYPVLDDYATVYLFFQWLKLQTNGTIYKEIIKSPNNDYGTVIKAFNATKTSGSDYSDWGSMLKDWLAANITNDSSGRDGYMNDPTLKNIKAPYAPTGKKTLGLYPGEGVYSYSATNVTPPTVGTVGNIKYAYLSGKQTLLTYNANSDNKKGIENGTTTGVKPNIVVSGKFNLELDSSVISGPFPIGMGDVIRMNNNGNRINFDSLPLQRVSIDE